MSFSYESFSLGVRGKKIHIMWVCELSLWSPFCCIWSCWCPQPLVRSSIIIPITNEDVCMFCWELRGTQCVRMSPSAASPVPDCARAWRSRHWALGTRACLSDAMDAKGDTGKAPSLASWWLLKESSTTWPFLAKRGSDTFLFEYFENENKSFLLPFLHVITDPTWLDWVKAM